MTTVILILAALTLILGIIEICIAPGFGLAGICSVICAVVDVVLVYNSFGTTWAIITILSALVVFGLMMWWVSRSKAFDRMALHSTIDSTNATREQLSVKVGDSGTALTRLALVGNAEINGKMVEVKSSGEFISPGAPVRVINVNEANITVERIPD